MASRIRVITALALFSLLSCASGPVERPTISIEFGAHPDEFRHSEVLIDGVLVGTLEPSGDSTRVSFPVEAGVHRVSLRHPRLGCLVRSVDARNPVKDVSLTAKVHESWREGRIHPVIVLGS